MIFKFFFIKFHTYSDRQKVDNLNEFKWSGIESESDSSNFIKLTYTYKYVNYKIQVCNRFCGDS